jgi:TonB family protein
MLKHNRSQTIYFSIVILFLAIGFTASRHKHKTNTIPNVVTEMPMPDVHKTYSPYETNQKEDVEDLEQIYQVIEQMPQFPGGEVELMDIITRRLKFPVSALRNDVQGKVILRFVITRTGRIVNPEVVRSLDPDCDREALRVLKSLPRFIPGKQNGRNVNVYYTLPIAFKLK